MPFTLKHTSRILIKTLNAHVANFLFRTDDDDEELGGELIEAKNSRELNANEKEN